MANVLDVNHAMLFVFSPPFDMHTHTYLCCYLFPVHLSQQWAEAGEHEKRRRVGSSVPRIGAARSSVNGFCGCVSVFVVICFHHFWKRGTTTLPTGGARELLSRTFLLSLPHLVSGALSVHLLVRFVTLCLRIKGCYCACCEISNH